jgi:hypothetical protein
MSQPTPDDAALMILPTLLRLIALRIGQGLRVIKHRAEIAHVKPVDAHFKFENMLCLIGRLHAVALADDGAARNSSHAAILVIPCFARLDRDFDFRAVTCPLDRAQDAPIRFIRDQSQQLSIFLVRLLKGESPISHSARVTHGISTPTQQNRD